jgi:hypothetical protein
MRVEDYYPDGKRWWVRLHEKGGKRHEMPAHHKLEAFIDEYLAVAGIREDGKTPLFRSAIGKTGLLTSQSDRLPRQTRCEGMRTKREIQMGASGGGQSIKASGHWPREQAGHKPATGMTLSSQKCP